MRTIIISSMLVVTILLAIIEMLTIGMPDVSYITGGIPLTVTIIMTSLLMVLRKQWKCIAFAFFSGFLTALSVWVASRLVAFIPILLDSENVTDFEITLGLFSMAIYIVAINIFGLYLYFKMLKKDIESILY